jgi:hypothetical protein
MILPSKTQVKLDSVAAVYVFYPIAGQSQFRCSTVQSELWHRRLAHPGHELMQQMIRGHSVLGGPTSAHEQVKVCEACLLGKSRSITKQAGVGTHDQVGRTCAL